MKVDGDVLEVFFGSAQERIPLARLAARMEHRRKNKVQMTIQWAC